MSRGAERFGRAGPDSPRQAVLNRRVRWLVATTIAYNVAEAVIVLAAVSLW